MIRENDRSGFICLRSYYTTKTSVLITNIIITYALPENWATINLFAWQMRMGCCRWANLTNWFLRVHGRDYHGEMMLIFFQKGKEEDDVDLPSLIW